MNFYRMALVFILTTLCACSYFKRRDCEGINWYDEGYKIAMRGQRPADDMNLKECRDVNAEIPEASLDKGFKAGMENYCRPEVVLQTGKLGNKFNTDLCNPSDLKNLNAQYAKGIEQYCLPENAYLVGSRGEVYQKQCNSTQEKNFMPAYRRGRKVYLSAQVREDEQKIREAEQKVSGYNFDLGAATSEKNRCEYQLERIKNERDPKPFAVQDAERELSDARSKVSRIESEISILRKSIETLEENIHRNNVELAGLSEN